MSRLSSKKPESGYIGMKAPDRLSRCWELTASSDADPAAGSIPEPTKSGLQARLDLRKRLLDATDIKFQYQCPEDAWRTVVPSKVFKKKDKRGKAAPKEDVERPSPDFDTISKTNDRKDPKESKPTVQQAFSEKIQRRLASTTPPRPMVELKFEEAISILKALWRDCDEAARIRVCNSVSNMKVSGPLRMLIFPGSSEPSS